VGGGLFGGMGRVVFWGGFGWGYVWVWGGGRGVLGGGGCRGGGGVFFSIPTTPEAGAEAESPASTSRAVPNRTTPGGAALALRGGAEPRTGRRPCALDGEYRGSHTATQDGERRGGNLTARGREERKRRHGGAKEGAE